MASRSPERYSLERFAVPQLRLRLHERADTVEAKDHLCVQWLLDPERAILVEFGDAIFQRHIGRAGTVGRGAHEVEDCLFRRTVVPGCKRCCGLSLRGSCDKKLGQHRQRRNCAEQETPA